MPNLGGGLEDLVRAGNKSLRRAAVPELSVTHPIRLDDAGRALVRISLNGKVQAQSVLQSLRTTPGVEVVASDLNYRAGVIEAYVPTDALVSVARKAGVLAVVPSSTMVTNVGAAQSQGVVQHRVNRIAGVDGRGITVGLMSDSFDTAPGRHQRGGRRRYGRSAGSRQSLRQHRTGRGLSGLGAERHRRRPRHDADRARSRAEGTPRLRDGERR